MTGGVASNGAMTIRNCADELLPRPSLEVHVTVVVPTAKVEPEPGEQFTGTEAPRSVALGLE